jgi:hypothetical protein
VTGLVITPCPGGSVYTQLTVVEITVTNNLRWNGTSVRVLILSHLATF